MKMRMNEASGSSQEHGDVLEIVPVSKEDLSKQLNNVRTNLLNTNEKLELLESKLQENSELMSSHQKSLEEAQATKNALLMFVAVTVSASLLLNIFKKGR